VHDPDPPTRLRLPIDEKPLISLGGLWGLGANRPQSRAPVEKAQGGLGKVTLISAQSSWAPNGEGKADFKIFVMATLAKGAVLLYEC
jgi:hypothetical protein